MLTKQDGRKDEVIPVNCVILKKKHRAEVKLPSALLFPAPLSSALHLLKRWPVKSLKALGTHYQSLPSHPTCSPDEKFTRSVLS